MPEVNVEIDGKRYRMACEEGQEPHLMALAERFNRTVLGLKSSFGEIGDNRLVVMAGIAVLDELAEAEDRIGALKQDIADLTSAGRELTVEAEALEDKFARRLNDAARKLEAIAQAIDETGAPAAS
ncbi:MAG TPA: cell division protein ZapA [Devosia sp.]|jgi:cell division protein ZapA|nr:cell division protein ZapA [Devosia sp.]